jgi:hypothetical protein
VEFEAHDAAQSTIHSLDGRSSGVRSLPRFAVARHRNEHPAVLLQRDANDLAVGSLRSRASLASLACVGPGNGRTAVLQAAAVTLVTPWGHRAHLARLRADARHLAFDIVDHRVHTVLEERPRLVSIFPVASLVDDRVDAMLIWKLLVI